MALNQYPGSRRRLGVQRRYIIFYDGSDIRGPNPQNMAPVPSRDMAPVPQRNQPAPYGDLRPMRPEELDAPGRTLENPSQNAMRDLAKASRLFKYARQFARFGRVNPWGLAFDMLLQMLLDQDPMLDPRAVRTVPAGWTYKGAYPQNAGAPVQPLGIYNGNFTPVSVTWYSPSTTTQQMKYAQTMIDRQRSWSVQPTYGRAVAWWWHAAVPEDNRMLFPVARLQSRPDPMTMFNPLKIPVSVPRPGFGPMPTPTPLFLPAFETTYAGNYAPGTQLSTVAWPHGETAYDASQGPKGTYSPVIVGRKPPTKGVKERKVYASFNGHRVGKFLNRVTDANDLIEALWYSLPKRVRALAKGDRRKSPQVRLPIIYQHLNEVRWWKFAENVVINEAGDWAVGSYSRRLNKKWRALVDQGLAPPSVVGRTAGPWDTTTMRLLNKIQKHIKLQEGNDARES